MEVSQYTTPIAASVCGALVIGMLIAFRLGRRAGIRHHSVDPDGARAVSGAVEASMFALLGLLIAFTFDGAADRFDARRALITDEANAVGSAYARIDLLAAADQASLRDAFRRYLDARIGYYHALPDVTAADVERNRALDLQQQIWRLAVDAVPRGMPGVQVVLLTAIDDMFNIAERRRAALEAHPPLPIYGLLICLALICAGLAGHHAFQAARHPWVIPLMFAGISGLAIYVILDLEYPRAGLIRIDAADAMLREVRARIS